MKDASEQTKTVASKPSKRTAKKPVAKWYVLRDLRRGNVKKRGYHLLKQRKIDVFSPINIVWSIRNGKKRKESKFAIPDLLIVHSTEEELSKYVTFANKLQFRFLRGGWMKKMVVSDTEMKEFIQAANGASSITYYSVEEYSPENIGNEITIKGGPFNGESGKLLSVRGTKNKQIVVRLSNLFVAVIELEAETKEDETTEETDIQAEEQKE